MVKGTLLGESLRAGAVLDVDGLTATRIYRRDVSESVTSSQPPVWTFIEFEGPDEIAGPLASALADTLLREGGWYGDFSVGDEHVVIFADRIFRYRRGDLVARREAEEHAASVGVPAHQLDWVD